MVSLSLSLSSKAFFSDQNAPLQHCSCLFRCFEIRARSSKAFFYLTKMTLPPTLLLPIPCFEIRVLYLSSRRRARLEMPAAAAAAARGPLLHLCRNPAPRLAAVRRSFSSSGMRCVSAAAGGGGGRERRSSPAYGGLLLDAGGTLLQLARPVAQTYASLGRRYGSYSFPHIEPPSFRSLRLPWHFVEHVPGVWPPGMSKSEESIKEGFKRAFSAPWPKTLRYQVIDMDTQ